MLLLFTNAEVIIVADYLDYLKLNKIYLLDSDKFYYLKDLGLKIKKN